MKTTLNVNERGFYRIVKTKEVVHYLNKMEKELVKEYGEIKGEMINGALSQFWYSVYINEEQIKANITWTKAQLGIIQLTGAIKDSTYDGLIEEMNKIYDDIKEKPI